MFFDLSTSLITKLLVHISNMMEYVSILMSAVTMVIGRRGVGSQPSVFVATYRTAAARPATATSVCTQQVALSLSCFVSITTVKVQIVGFNTRFLVFFVYMLII